MFAYEVTYWDEVNDKKENDHGIVYGKTFAEMNKNVVYYYGEENVIELKLFAISEKEEPVLSAMEHNFLPSYEEMKEKD